MITEENRKIPMYIIGAGSMTSVPEESSGIVIKCKEFF